MRIMTSLQRGFSMVELMVGLVVGLFAVLAAGAVYINAFASGHDSMRLARLNQDMRAIMDVMTADLHRAGYSAKDDNSFMQRTGNATDIQVSTDNTCILYTFDLDRDGAVDADELFGFRFDSAGQRVQTLASTVAFPATTTANVTDCAALTWEPLNFAEEVRVTALSFSTQGSKCLAFNPATFVPANAATFTQWQLATTSSAAACDTVPAGVTVPAGQTGRAEVREVQITLTARSTRDTTLQRTLNETVRLHNDRVN